MTQTNDSGAGKAAGMGGVSEAREPRLGDEAGQIRDSHSGSTGGALHLAVGDGATHWELGKGRVANPVLTVSRAPLADPAVAVAIGTSEGGGDLAPGASCTFSIPLDVPPLAVSNAYPSATSNLTATLGAPLVFPPATDVLQVAFAPNDACVESTIVADVAALAKAMKINVLVLDAPWCAPAKAGAKPVSVAPADMAGGMSRSPW